jgi:hypothetical protein
LVPRSTQVRQKIQIRVRKQADLKLQHLSKKSAARRPDLIFALYQLVTLRLVVWKTRSVERMNLLSNCFHHA